MIQLCSPKGHRKLFEFIQDAAQKYPKIRSEWLMKWEDYEKMTHSQGLCPYVEAAAMLRSEVAEVYGRQLKLFPAEK